MAGARLLRAADLFRLLRLLRHGHRTHAHVRISSPREFQLPLYFAVGARILAALAHLVVEFLPGLSVHPAGRQRARKSAHVRESAAGISALRALAWGELDVRAVGRLAWRVPDRGARGPG